MAARREETSTAAGASATGGATTRRTAAAQQREHAERLKDMMEGLSLGPNVREVVRVQYTVAAPGEQVDEQGAVAVDEEGQPKEAKGNGRPERLVVRLAATTPALASPSGVYEVPEDGEGMDALRDALDALLEAHREHAHHQLKMDMVAVASASRNPALTEDEDDEEG